MTEQKIKIKTKLPWWKDKNILSPFILLFCVVFQIFAFLEVDFFTTIHRYTVGMFLGWYNPLLYMLIIVVCIKNILKDKFKTPKWYKLSYSYYFLICIAIIFFSISISILLDNKLQELTGKEVWEEIFRKWWDDFTISNNSWLPSKTNGGIFGAFIYCLFASWATVYGTIVFAVLLLIAAFSTIFLGNPLLFYKRVFNKMWIFIKVKIFKNNDITSMDKKESEIDILKFDDSYNQKMNQKKDDNLSKNSNKDNQTILSNDKKENNHDKKDVHLLKSSDFKETMPSKK